MPKPLHLGCNIIGVVSGCRQRAPLTSSFKIKKKQSENAGLGGSHLFRNNGHVIEFIIQVSYKEETTRYPQCNM
ncbi:hypothetical protein BDV36DRAFT_133187 [Aspergillus pseudocaelatus]|uniref:Uncharacterized protein n=1 Tax=Aspergillus pseudocaelatus TaxID=1825620 RepID=A0ABQ6X275_9EURO|nr:hypothetical protein BDV36DRAFT_133187 [Aspergillus pseudocaelatus]